MPVFTYYCLGCDHEFKKLVKNKDEEVIHSCGDHLKPQLPKTLNTVTKELKDPYRGKSLQKGHKEMMIKRMNQHHDKYEAERKIDEFGIDDAKRLGWDKKVKRT